MAISLSLVTLNCTEIHLSGAPKLKSSLARTLDSSSGMGVVILLSIPSRIPFNKNLLLPTLRTLVQGQIQEFLIREGPHLYPDF